MEEMTCKMFHCFRGMTTIRQKEGLDSTASSHKMERPGHFQDQMAENYFFVIIRLVKVPLKRDLPNMEVELMKRIINYKLLFNLNVELTFATIL